MHNSKFLVSFIQSSGYSPCEIYLLLKSYSTVKNHRETFIVSFSLLKEFGIKAEEIS